MLKMVYHMTLYKIGAWIINEISLVLVDSSLSRYSKEKRNRLQKARLEI